MFNCKNISYILRKASKILQNVSGSVENAQSDARILLENVLNISSSQLILSSIENKQLNHKQIKKYEKYILRRLKNEPVAYIIGYVKFMGLEFKVNNHVLIPRYETEILVEEALKLDNNKSSILDLCTGSGCIAISLAKLSNVKTIIASDISYKAIAIAKQNASLNSVLNRITFIVSDLFTTIEEHEFDMIVSNPPYITQSEYNIVKYNLKYEPKNALVASDNGLLFYKYIAKYSKYYLNSNSFILVELNSNNVKYIKEIFLAQNAYKNIEIINDYAKLPRILKAQKKG
ncbi:MAG: peptide chain release factor N(5)-glutamine methyltransferase [Endomicrobium sp.]|jgi:release factor glutamine methyltransferase|nr:peptide chain release factor N(5)-glutamine methyltransferase [Endomicrobium sp.]